MQTILLFTLSLVAAVLADYCTTSVEVWFGFFSIFTFIAGIGSFGMKKTKLW